MYNDTLPQNEVTVRILNAADRLMAKQGVQNLSTHKIAKEAGVSVGTIYLHFKDKEDLLHQLVLYLFNRFHLAVDSQYDESLPLFEQYKKLWDTSWQFMLDNPNVVKNMHQYESLPQFQTVMREYLNAEWITWNKFVKAGQLQNVIANLPSFVLFAISMKTTWELMYQQLMLEKPYPQSLLDEAALRTWKAITI